MPRLRKDTQKERAVKLHKALQKNKDNASKVAKSLGITRQAVHARKLKNPEFQTIRQQAIQKASKETGFTLARIYGALNDGLDANSQASYLGKIYESDHPDHRVRTTVAKIGLELFEHIGGDTKEETKPTEIHVYYGHRTKPPNTQQEDK